MCEHGSACECDKVSVIDRVYGEESECKQRCLSVFLHTEGFDNLCPSSNTTTSGPGSHKKGMKGLTLLLLELLLLLLLLALLFVLLLLLLLISLAVVMYTSASSSLLFVLVLPSFTLFVA